MRSTSKCSSSSTWSTTPCMHSIKTRRISPRSISWPCSVNRADWREVELMRNLNISSLASKKLTRKCSLQWLPEQPEETTDFSSLTSSFTSWSSASVTESQLVYLRSTKSYTFLFSRPSSWLCSAFRSRLSRSPTCLCCWQFRWQSQTTISMSSSWPTLRS